MTDDLQQARVEAALNGFYETEHKQAGWARPFVRTAGLENWSPQSIARMEAALAAADAHLPGVEQIAEVLQAHRYIPVVNGPEKCSCGESFRDRWAHEVHLAVLLRGEVAGNE